MRGGRLYIDAITAERSALEDRLAATSDAEDLGELIAELAALLAPYPAVQEEK